MVDCSDTNMHRIRIVGLRYGRKPGLVAGGCDPSQRVLVPSASLSRDKDILPAIDLGSDYS